MIGVIDHKPLALPDGPHQHTVLPFEGPLHGGLPQTRAHALHLAPVLATLPGLSPSLLHPVYQLGQQRHLHAPAPTLCLQQQLLDLEY